MKKSKKPETLRCKLPCGCWVEWEQTSATSARWNYYAVTGGWAHGVRSRPKLHDESNPNLGGQNRRFLAAAMVASGYGLAAQARKALWFKELAALAKRSL